MFQATALKPHGCHACMGSKWLNMWIKRCIACCPVQIRCYRWHQHQAFRARHLCLCHLQTPRVCRGSSNWPQRNAWTILNLSWLFINITWIKACLMHFVGLAASQRSCITGHLQVAIKALDQSRAFGAGIIKARGPLGLGPVGPLACGNSRKKISTGFWFGDSFGL